MSPLKNRNFFYNSTKNFSFCAFLLKGSLRIMKKLNTLVLGMLCGFALTLLFFVPVESSSAAIQAFFAPTGEKRLLHKALTQEIYQAKKTVQIAMFQWTSPALTDAIISVKNQAQVQILLDEEQIDSDWSKSKELKKAGIEIRYFKLPGTGFQRVKMHHKFMIVDQKTVATGSMNWTVQADEQNYEALLILKDKLVAKQFTQAFEELWKTATPWK